MNIQITSDTSCDLSKEILEKNNIKTIPIVVLLGDKELYDGVNVQVEDLFTYVQESKKLPKTAARSKEEYKEFFEQFTNNGSTVVHIGLSSQLSVSYQNAVDAAKEIGEDKVFIVDSLSLSTGIGLLLLHASELVRKGKTAKQIYEIETDRAKSVQASFVVDTLEYLYKNGRCSALAMFGANLLKIHPSLQLIEGKIVPTQKYRGKMDMILKKYIDDSLAKFSNPDTTRCFVTHSSADPSLVEEIVTYVQSKNIFKEVLVTVAGPTITSHCGKGTLGLLYINDGGRR